MKKVVVISAGIIAVGFCYYLTRSWVASLVIVGGLVLYGAWLILFELGLWRGKKRMDEMHRMQHSVRARCHGKLRGTCRTY